MPNPTYELHPFCEDDRGGVIEIFNDYILNSFAAFPETALEEKFFDTMLAVTRNYPSAVLTLETGGVAGYGFLKPHHPMQAFRKTADISYFLRRDLTGKGYGKVLLDSLMDGAQTMGLTCIMASISSRNEHSLKFHAKHGFTECGRFVTIGEKFGEKFDVVWMQRFLSPQH